MTAPTAPRFETGAWVTYRSINNPNAADRKVTVVGYDADGWALYAEGWIDVRATNARNLTVEEV